jgi:hypothetical protein
VGEISTKSGISKINNVDKFRVVLKPREKIKRVGVVPLFLEVTKHIDLRETMIFWKNLVAAAAMVAAAVAAAMAVGRERPEVRRLGLHVCR